MSHSQIYGYFIECLPEQAKQAKEYFPNGQNSIRIRMKNGQDLIFSSPSHGGWKYESFESFRISIKGDQKSWMK